MLLYHPIDFTDYEWSILEKISFDIRDPPMTNLYRIYSGDIREDLNILDFELRGEDLYYKRQSKSLEQVWIDKDGHLYARTDFDDIEDKIRKYKNGHHNVSIEYTNNKKYANCSKQSYLDINSPIYDVDIHSYELTYNDKTPIRAWITEYNFTSNENKPINEGMAYFFIDGSFIDKIKVQNGLAILPRDSITLLSSQKHLISVEYAPVIKGQNRTYSYDSGSEYYLRSTNGAAHMDRMSNKQLHYKNIIIQKVENKTIDSEGRQELTTCGTGSGFYITNGYARPITWSKASRNGKTRFTYSDGTEVIFNDGNTFIQIVPTTSNVTIG